MMTRALDKLFGAVAPSLVMLCWMLVYVGTARRPEWLQLWVVLLIHAALWLSISIRLWRAA